MRLIFAQIFRFNLCDMKPYLKIKSILRRIVVLNIRLLMLKNGIQLKYSFALLKERNGTQLKIK